MTESEITVRSVVGPVIGSQVITGDQNKITIMEARATGRARAPRRRATAERVLFGAHDEPVTPRPLAMLRPDAGILPHQVRPEDAALLDWCLAPAHPRVRLLVGRGGQGKTTTALHLAAVLRQRGWLAGFVDLASRRSGETGTRTDDRVWARFAATLTSRPVRQSPTLLVVDYAENVPVMLRRLLTAIRDVPSVRLLLLSRDEGDWWPDLLSEPMWTRMIHAEPLVLNSLTSRLDTCQIADVHAEAVRRFAKFVPDAPRDLVVEQTSTRRYETTLDLYAEALLSVLDAAAVAREEEPVRSAGEDPLCDLLAHEMRHVRSALSDRQINLGVRDRNLVLAAPFLMPAVSIDDAVKLLASLELEGAHDESMLRGTAQVLGKLYPDARSGVDGVAGVWAAPRPDRLPDTHLLGLADRASSDADWTRLILRLCGTDDAGSAEQVTRTLLRCISTPGAGQRFPVGLRRVTNVVDALVRAHPKGYVWPAMLLRPGGFTTAVHASLERGAGLSTGDVRQIQLRLLDLGSSTSRAFEAVQVSRRLVRDTQPQGFVDVESLALHSVYLGLHAGHLNAVGEREQALETAASVTGIQELLAVLDPVHGLWGLAVSLNDLSVLQTDLGRHDDALESIQRATDLYQQMIDARGDFYLSFFAGSLTNLAKVLEAMGRREEALEPARRAVQLHQQLIDAKQDGHLHGLGISLVILASCLSHSGRTKQALEPAVRAVDLMEGLAAANPDAHLPVLATALTILANIRSKLGNWRQAVECAERAVDAYRRLSDTNPNAYLPHLASSQAALSISLRGDDARRGEALVSAQQAAELYERLAQAHPGAYRSQLAAGYSTLSSAYQAAGRAVEAVELARRAVDQYDQLADPDNEHGLADLAAALINLAVTLRSVKRYEESLEHTVRAVDMLDRVAATNPEAHLVNLGQAIDNLVGTLVQMGRDEEARVAAKRAVGIHNTLLKADSSSSLRSIFLSHTGLSGAYSALGELDLALEQARRAVVVQEQLAGWAEADLAKALSNVGSLLGQLGRHHEAVGPARRAVELRERLVADNPAHLPNLAGSLLNYSAVLTDLGEYEEAYTTGLRSIELFEHLSAEDPEHLADLAKALNNFAGLMAEDGHEEAALPVLERAIDLQRRLVQEKPDKYLDSLELSLMNLAMLEGELGRGA